MQESPRSRLPFTTVPIMPVPVTVTARAWRARPCVTVRIAGRPRAVLAAGTARGPGPPPPPPAAALAPATQCKQSQGVQRVEKINGYLLQDHFQVLPLFQHVLICHLPHLMINHQVRACAVPELEISQEVSFTCSRFIISTSCCIISTCNCIICCVNAVKPKCLHSAYQNFQRPFFRHFHYSQPSLLISCI